jgi:hypothetical protein
MKATGIDVASLQPTNFPKRHKFQNPYRYHYRYRQVTERQRVGELVGHVSAKILMTARRVLESPTTARRRKLCTELQSLALRDQFLGVPADDGVLGDPTVFAWACKAPAVSQLAGSISAWRTQLAKQACSFELPSEHGSWVGSKKTHAHLTSKCSRKVKTWYELMLVEIAWLAGSPGYCIDAHLATVRPSRVAKRK